MFVFVGTVRRAFPFAGVASASPRPPRDVGPGFDSHKAQLSRGLLVPLAAPRLPLPNGSTEQ